MSDASTSGEDPRWVLLTNLVAERAKAACNAVQSKREDVARVNEGMEAAFRVAIGHTIGAFYGVEAAAAYGRDGILPPDDAGVAEAATPASDPHGDTPENAAWHSVWLHGNWRYLTSQMTTPEREHAARCVERYDRVLAEVDGESHRGGPEGLRWWR
ncbi:hypothetical protein, partial [Streptomyces capuensis]|uniref:hypothetical protein n=1 Tax=Streptomyces capuensis TaxID=1464056 RepID=UPI000518A182